MTDAEIIEELLATCKAYHTALDASFAMLVEITRGKPLEPFFPTRSAHVAGDCQRSRDRCQGGSRIEQARQDMTALPRLELSDHHRSPFDDAVLIIDGREEHTITIECEHALDLAHRLILYVNAHDQVVKILTAAMHALRSYQFGNSAPDLAQGIADDLEVLIKETGEAA